LRITAAMGSLPVLLSGVSYSARGKIDARLSEASGEWERPEYSPITPTPPPEFTQQPKHYYRHKSLWTADFPPPFENRKRARHRSKEIRNLLRTRFGTV